MMKLSKAQMAALSMIVERGERWMMARRWRTDTLTALRRHGLIEDQVIGQGFGTYATHHVRATAAGRTIVEAAPP